MKEAVILAGGFGTRLRHVVSDVPKPMAPIGERPFLEILIDYLATFGYDHIVLSTGYLHEKIEQHFGCEYKGIRISYAQETTPLGTGGGILNALQHCQNETVTVLNGDTMFKVDYSALEQFHQQNGTMLSIFLRQVDDTSRYGSVEIDNSHRIIRFAEKSESQGQGWINGGIYRMDKALFDGYQVGDTFSFEKDIMQANYQSKSLFALPSSSYFIDIGVPDDYFRAQKELI
ncbi:MAG: nucleotidyltransferase family protein [Bacteroidales bacterium]|nr:nucleotidyltransferase family protein [Bacteroidales bacterium]